MAHRAQLQTSSKGSKGTTASIASKLILALSMIALFVQGCAKKEQSTAVRSSRVARSGGVTSSSTSRGAFALTQGNLSNEDWMRSIRAYVSSSNDPNSVGTVSGNAYSNTGIRFTGYAQATTKVSTTGYNYSQITNNSYLHITIVDSFSGTMDRDGNVIPNFEFDYQGGATGYISGNYVAINFNDSYLNNNGETYSNIVMRGTISGTTFTGYIGFINSQYWDGQSPGAQGEDVWAFSIPTCSFFNCQ